MTRYHTKSGSIYEVEDRNGETWIRRAAGGAHYAGRCDDWKQCYDAHVYQGRLLILWGGGRDEHSPTDDGIPDDLRQRTTETSRVVRVEHTDDNDPCAYLGR